MAGKSMFRYADSIDKFLMFFGTLGSIGDGLQVPLMMYILKDVINAYGDKNSGLTNDMVDTVRLAPLCKISFLMGNSIIMSMVKNIYTNNDRQMERTEGKVRKN
uniref:ABC transmembrane type-1 domain-containing protein n=1 Tax=Cucumis sativus TaxID=3659 RepID=A0A0A0LD58_CUCSA